MTDAGTIAVIRSHAALFDIPEQAVIATTTDGHIVYWSKAATALYGWSEQDAMGRDVLDVTPAELTRAEAATIMENLRKGLTWSGLFNVQRRDGKEFLAYVRDVPVHHDGALVGIVGISKPAPAKL